MRLTQVLAAAGVIAAVPASALLLLAVAGAARPGPVLAVLGATLLSAGVIGAYAVRDLTRLGGAVQAALRGEAYAGPGIAIGAVQDLAGEIDRLRRQQAASAALAERLRRVDQAVVDRFPDPLVLLAPDRSLRRANPAARTAYGGDLGSLLRHPSLLGALDRAALRPGEVETAELRLPAPVLRDVLATVMTFDPPLPDGEQALVMLADRTREHAAERTRADFVANVSHELRTPLASLIGFIDTLRGPARDDKPAQQRFLDIMAEQAARMNRLIDDLLSLSRVEMAEHQAPADALDLGTLLPRIAAGFEPRLRERAVRLRVDLPQDLPAVIGDADQVTQVVQNLLDNALKYGRPSGEIALAATAHAQAPRWPARPGVVISVRDEGMGIGREHLPRLGERFYRVDRGRSRAEGGTGLGLAIVKHIVNRHRGQLQIDSIEGKGTTVRVWLPQAAPARRAAATVA